MSTLLENIIFPTKNILYSKFFVVQKEKLGDVVKRTRNAKDLSLADVRARSGNRLATSYISRIENNQVKPDKISPAKLSALAQGIGEPEEYIFDLARGKSPGKEIIAEHRFVEIAAGFSNLPEQERRNLEPLLQAIENTIEQHKNKPGKTAAKKAENEQGEEQFRAGKLTAPQVLPESEYEQLGLKKVNLKKKKTLNTK